MDRFFGSDQGGDFQLGDAPDVVDGQHVQRVGHGQEQLVLQPGNRHDLVIVADVARQQFGDFLLDVQRGRG